MENVETAAASPATRTGAPPTLRAQVVKMLSADILAGKYKPGDRLNESQIARELNISRIPVREALRQLQTEGLVVLAPNRGAWIADVTSQESIEVYKIREVLEPLAIAESVPHLSDEDIAALDEMVQRLESCDSIQEYISLDRQFHLKTYSRAPLPQLRRMVERFWNNTQHFRRWFVKDSLAKDGLPFSDPQHLMLMAMLRARDAEGARSIVHLHIRRTRLLIEKMAADPAAGWGSTANKLPPLSDAGRL